MSLSVKAAVSAGSDIREACKEAIDLANRIGVIVEFNFNRVKCFAKPGADPYELADLWLNELQSDRAYKVVCAHPPAPTASTEGEQ